jgi:hypothetical protein
LGGLAPFSGKVIEMPCGGIFIFGHRHGKKSF